MSVHDPAPVAGPSTATSLAPVKINRKYKRKKSKPDESKRPVINLDFTGGADYIPFDFGDSEEEEKDRKGKGKEKSPPPQREKSSSRRKGRDRDESPPSGPRAEREWDRGKPKDRDRDRGGEAHAGTKRKYDMVFDEDDLRNRSRNSGPITPWLDTIDFDDCTNIAEVLHREVSSFASWISPTPHEHEIRTLTMTLITKAIQRAFPDAEVHAFGSFETMLYLPGGDIDLVILSQSMAYSKKDTVLTALARTIQNAGIAHKVSIIGKARVPIVKFVTTHGRLKVDLSVNQSSGILGGQIVNGFLRSMQSPLALRSLIMITKHFLDQRNMNEVYTGGLGSYSIVCLAVSFLQMHPKIRRGEMDPDRNLGVLLLEFFELYGSFFNYENTGISVRDGGTYFSKRQRGWYDSYKPGALSIEDPADMSNDISGGSFNFQSVRKTFQGAHSILAAACYMRSGILRSQRDGTALSFRSRYLPEDLSVLSSVMSVTRETVNHRKMIEDLYQQGTLHDMCGVRKEEKVPEVEVIVDKGEKTGRPTGNEKPSMHDVWVSKKDDKEERDMVLSSHVDNEEEEGRYGISSKRRKVDLVPEVFTTDDSEEEGQIGPLPLEVEEAKEIRRNRTGRNRDYWLSKGPLY